MKLLLDSCVWGGAVQTLRDAGHEVDWCGNWPKDPGDNEILTIAHREGCILVTLDKDFGELAVLHGSPHCGIIRLVDVSAHQQAARCFDVLALHGDFVALLLPSSPAGCEFDLRRPKPSKHLSLPFCSGHKTIDALLNRDYTLHHKVVACARGPQCTFTKPFWI
ncbi:MAG: DUF5615 family PIN-like protein [Pirellulales bacterium]